MNLATVEIKAFVPARDFELSKRFYRDLGFEVPWSSDDLAYLHAGDSSFLLQKFYNREHAENFMMHLLVRDVEAWWQHVVAQELVERYGVQAEPPEDRPWAIRDFTLTDPAGVLWRIGQNIPATQEEPAMPDEQPKFESTSLSGARFHDVDLRSSSFDDVALADASFSNVSFKGAKFANIDFRNVEISDANVAGMTINGILMTDLLYGKSP
ncbi:MAG: pentapeptide repeat-containing protein [Proteobacteria bacterium]|nr:pentapeptide repeat-containing protein [Pseudomonadota bacterium]